MLIEKMFEREFIPNGGDLSEEQNIILLDLDFDEEDVYDIDEYEEQQYRRRQERGYD